MNTDKARDFFSAYFEGTLDAGLRQTFEQRLRADAQLQAEYAAFERTMTELSRLRQEEIEVPFYLSDRIATRLEEAQSRRPAPSFLSLWLPRLTVGAVAAAAIVGAVLSLGGSDERVSVGGGLPSVSGPAAGPTFAAQGLGVEFRLRSNETTQVVFADASGKAFKTIDVRPNEDLRSPLSNPNANASLVQLKVGEETVAQIALPGTAAAQVKEGTGTVRDFALAIAGNLRRPVVLQTTNVTPTVTWKLEGNDARLIAERTLGEAGYEVMVSGAELLTIRDR